MTEIIVHFIPKVSNHKEGDQENPDLLNKVPISPVSNRRLNFQNHDGDDNRNHPVIEGGQVVGQLAGCLLIGLFLVGPQLLPFGLLFRTQLQLAAPARDISISSHLMHLLKQK